MNKYHKIGRPRRFKDPETLWNVATEYFEYSDNNPVKTKDWVGSKKIEVMREQVRPYTLAAFCLFAGVNKDYWRNFKRNNKNNPEFLWVIDRIENIIFVQLFQGAAIGVFNAKIVYCKIYQDLRMQKEIAAKNNNTFIFKNE